jgi:hypothetical protein
MPLKIHQRLRNDDKFFYIIQKFLKCINLVEHLQPHFIIFPEERKKTLEMQHHPHKKYKTSLLINKVVTCNNLELS